MKGLIDCKDMEIIEQIHSITDSLGSKGFSYAVKPKSKQQNPSIVSNFPQHWKNKYEKLSFHHIDPIMVYAQKSTLPFHWVDVGSKPFLDVRNVRVSKHVIPGVLNGYTIPLHDHMDNVIAFSVWGEKQQLEMMENDKRLNDDVYRRILILHESTLQKYNQCPEDKLQILSARELQVLNLVSRGKTYSEVSNRLSISENTVKFHVKNILTKLNSSNMKQAIAAMRGW